MQRYRVNYPLLIGLVVGAIVIVGGGFGLWRFQLERNAGRLLDRSRVAKEEGDLVKSISLLSQYVSIRSEDEEAMAELANRYADLANAPDVEPQKLRVAFNRLEAIIRDQPDNTTLRRRMVDLMMSPRIRSFKGALDHIAQLLNRNPGDSELELLRSQCLFATNDPQRVEHAYKLVGYDRTADAFDAQKAVVTDDVPTYVRLAVALQVDDDEKELANRVMDQLVESNPEDGRAVLARGQFRVRNGEAETGEADIREALRLDPGLPAAVIANARLLADEEKVDEAIALLEGCLADHPDDQGLYQTLASMEIRRKDYPAAIERYEQGLKAIPPEEAQMLAFYKARLQIENEQTEDARQTIAGMREVQGILPPLLEYLEARIAMFEGNFVKAARDFEDLAAFMERIPDMRSELHFLRGFCYEKMGQFDKSLAAYNVTLQGDPNNAMAKYGKTRMEDRLDIGSAREKADTSIYAALTDELGKPEKEQDWVAFQPLIDEYVKRLKLGDAMKAVIEGEVLMRRGKHAEARQRLLDSYKLDPDNLGVRRAAVKLFALDPDQGPVKALKLLDKVVKDFGDKPILRLERADLFIKINDENVREQLFELTEGSGDWPRREQEQLWSGLAQRFEQMRDREARQICLSKVVELSPNNIATLQRLFMMARQADDESGMREVQERIEGVLSTKDDPVYKFTEAHVAISRYRSQEQKPEYLADAEDAIEKALDERPEWHQLHLLKAETALLKGDEGQALKSFDRAAEYGPPTAVALLQHVKLLVRKGRYADAVSAAERAPDERLRIALLGRDYADALLASGEAERAVGVANKIADNTVNDAGAQLWHGSFLMRAAASPTYLSQKKEREALTERAGESLAKATELNPKSQEAWLTYIGYLASNNRKIDAEDAIREAHLELVEDQSMLVFARCYEMIGRWIDAEQRYKAALDDAVPEARARAARLLAAFYVGQFYPGQDRLAKATPLINEILRAVADGDLDSNDQNARWARSTAARLLANSGEYQKIRDAEALLSSNAVDGDLRIEDRALMAKILAARPEPISRMKAARLYEQLEETGRLPMQSELELAQIYYSLGEWRQCREQMINLIARYPKEPVVRTRYLGMLLERGGSPEIDEATRQVKRLLKLQPKELSTRELVARLALKRGKRKEAIGALSSMLPRNLRNLKEDQVPLVMRVAGLLNEFDDNENAEKLYKAAASRGGATEKLEYARFVGEEIDPERGLKLLSELRDDAPILQVLQRAILIVRTQATSGEPIDRVAATVEGWLAAALREDPELLQLSMQEAELRDIQGDYAGAAKIYRGLLKRDDLTGINRAVVLNNFAYLLALTRPDSQAVAEARACIDEAVALLGPGTDILDTRAVVAIAEEKYTDAIADLEKAVIDRPTSDKYFHKATAHLMAGQTDEAIAAWESAVERGLSAESVSPMERDQYEQVKQQLEGLGMRSASL